MPDPKPEPQNPLAIGIIEASRLLGISEGSLRTRTREGIIPHLRIGGRLLYSVDALRAWLIEQAMSNVTPTNNVPADNGRNGTVDHAGGAHIATIMAQLERKNL